MSDKAEQRFFQWLVGERKGEILVFDTVVEEDGMIFIVFKDGSRINEEFVMNLNETDVSNRMMAEIENPSKCWTFKEIQGIDDKPRIEKDWESQTTYEVPTADEIAQADLTGQTGVVNPVKKMKKIELIPPPRTRPAIVESRFATIVNQVQPAAKEVVTTNQTVVDESVTPSKPSVDSNDPVYIMMEKSKKVDTEVDMSLTISLPSASLFDVVRDSFEDGDSKALEYIIENIDISDIKEALKEGIKSMYGPNEDPEDNKIAVWSDEKKMEMQGHIDHDLSQVKVKDFEAALGTFYEPDVVDEPIIREARPEEAETALIKELKEKAEKINQENE